MENVFSNRLIAARKMAGLSLQGLSDKLGNAVTKQSLNKYEQGVMRPDSQLLIALAGALAVTVDYFYSTPSVLVELTNVSYRKYSSKLTKIEEVSVEERAKEGFERYFELEEVLNFQEKNKYFNYPNIISTPEDAEQAAKALRQDWELGYDPITDVVEMLEDKGYKVIEIDAPDAFDGMKADINGKPVIVLKKCKTEQEDVVRKRFTALHELAHHALKFSESLTEKQEETLCHSFASAVLYPEDMARKELHKDRFHFYERELVIIKQRWGISIAAIFSRAKQLGIINDHVYRMFNRNYRQRKLHLNEPGRFLSREKPTRMERLVYLALAKEVLTINEAAHFAGISSWKLREQMNQMV